MWNRVYITKPGALDVPRPTFQSEGGGGGKPYHLF